MGESPTLMGRFGGRAGAFVGVCGRAGRRSQHLSALRMRRVDHWIWPLVPSYFTVNPVKYRGRPSPRFIFSLYPNANPSHSFSVTTSLHKTIKYGVLV